MTDPRFNNRQAPPNQDSRASREAMDRPQTEDRVVTDEARLEQYRMSIYSNALPNLPEIPGFHVCYLTTTNPRDTVEGRMALGYQLIKVEDYPKGAFLPAIKGGVFEGYVGYHEMVAAKIPMELYQMYMRESHFDAPNREEEKLVQQVEGMKEQARGYGAKVQVGSGIEEMASNLRRARNNKPIFQ